MSIYTITLKRELLSGSDTRATNSVGQPNNRQSNWKFGERGEDKEGEGKESSSERLIAEGDERTRGESSSSHNIIDGGEKVYGYNRRGEEEGEAYSTRATRDKKTIEEEDERIDRLLDCVCSKKVVKVGGDQESEDRRSFEGSDKEKRLAREGGGKWS